MLAPLRLLEVLILVSLTTAPSHASSNNYIAVFAEMQSQDTFIWPCPASSASDISSTFGPRIKVSTNAYDFHRGVDISGTVGDPVVAPYDGVVEQLAEFPDGGLSVVLRHEFPTSGSSAKLFDNSNSTTLFYTLYMHLDEMLVEEGDDVSQGTTIGTIGMTGATTSPHLHYEVRLGSPCSLEYAIENPSTECNNFGYDPHISAMLILPLAEVGIAQVSAQFLNDREAVVSNNNSNTSTDKFVRIATPANNPNVNGYRISIVQPNGQVRDVYELDLNRRIGFDATSTLRLDTQNTSFPYMDPLAFGGSANTWSTNLGIPEVWFGKNEAANESLIVEVVDVWGKLAAFALGKTSW